LANSLAPGEQAASVDYLRDRLVAFERMTAKNPTAFAAAQAQYHASLVAAGATSAQTLAPEQVRPFVERVASLIDHTYLAGQDREDIPQNIDAYLATLDDPFARVMSILDLAHQTSFLGAARNLTDVQNNNMMYDTRMTIGYPLVEGLYMYPLSQLGTFQNMVNLATNYSVSSRRYSWLYFASDVFGDADFRKLLNIAGVQDYLTLPEPAVERAVAAPDSGLKQLSTPAAPSPPQYLLIKDERADDPAYLARPVKAENTAAVAAAIAATHAYYRLRIGEAAYRETLEPLLTDLLQLQQRNDAIIGAPASMDVAREDENPARRGGRVSIDNIVGPRTGIDVSCPDPSCWLVYTMATVPGWKAYIDDKPAAIARANYAFLAVAVPRGQHYVAFLYAPDIDTLATFVSLVTLLVMLEWTWRRRAAPKQSV
ncbi:MAG TPA: YfhO family protein, partial [Stellaceae bacterium]|nr:YfhO family protein [Stellaceae bacterium]